MQFNSIDFLIFFPVVLLIYYIVPKKVKIFWLLISSWIFYMNWNPRYILLLLAVTISTYIGGVLIEKKAVEGKEKTKRWIFRLTVILNLLLLCYFKYLMFASGIFGIRLYILLPVGISFYIFQALGYTTDVYRETIKAERNFVRYALFVSFFPQLVAGPIERSENLLSQLHRLETRRIWTFEGIINGAILMIWGFFLKIVIADRISLLSDEIFNNYSIYGRRALILGAVCFSIQIYCDFAGYSFIAIGTAKCFGIELMENFSSPYFSENIKEFWNRWHISLSKWLKDYIYFPMGGSRCGKWRNYFNLLITFLISGIWHGAGFKYIAWGLLHATYQIVNRATEKIRKTVRDALQWKVQSFSYHVAQIFFSFTMVAFAWIFFRSDTLTDACGFIKNMIFNVENGAQLRDAVSNANLSSTDIIVLFVAISVLSIFDLIRKYHGTTINEFLMLQTAPFRMVTVLMLLLCVLKYGIYGEDIFVQPFVYFQF